MLSAQTLSTTHTGLCLAQRRKYRWTRVSISFPLAIILLAKSTTSGWFATSGWNENTYGVSDPAIGWGAVSTHVPCIQRTNALDLLQIQPRILWKYENSIEYITAEVIQLSFLVVRVGQGEKTWVKYTYIQVEDCIEFTKRKEKGDIGNNWCMIRWWWLTLR